MSTLHAARVRLVVAALVVAGAVGVALLAPRGPGTAHAAQKEGPWPKSDDPLFPKDAKDADAGYTDCAECHGQPVGGGNNSKFAKKAYKSHEFILLSEGTTWTQEDPHSSAFKVLKGPLGQKMAEILKYDVTKAPQCLTCHAVDKYPGMALPKSEEDVLKRFARAEGVTCSGCHGVRTTWRTAHYKETETPDAVITIPWRILTPEEKEQQGMRNLRDPVVKAKLCATCHVGDPDTHRVVTHDIYAAGHPPLPPFELASFMNCEPMHWGSTSSGELNFFTEKGFTAYFGGAAVAKKNPNWMWDYYRAHPEAKEIAAARHVAAGAIASLHAEMKLIAADAAAVMAADGAGLDFARFDCYACHHDLKYPSDRQKRGYTWAPGRPPLKAWTTALPGVVADHAATLKTFANEGKGFHPKWDAAQKAATDRPFGKPKELADAAKAMVTWSEAFLKKNQSEANPVYTKDEAAKLLAAIGDAAVKKWSADPEAAMHLTWAYTALRAHSYGKIDEAGLAELRAVLPVEVRKPRRDEKGRPTFSNEKGEPLTVTETLRTRLDLFNRYNSQDFIRSFGKLTGYPPK